MLQALENRLKALFERMDAPPPPQPSRFEYLIKEMGAARRKSAEAYYDVLNNLQSLCAHQLATHQFGDFYSLVDTLAAEKDAQEAFTASVRGAAERNFRPGANVADVAAFEQALSQRPVFAAILAEERVKADALQKRLAAAGPLPTPWIAQNLATIRKVLTFGLK